MGGTQWPIDKNEDEMPLFNPVSLSRGRKPQLDTQVVLRSFTSEQLDAVAPLSLRDVLSLRNKRPTPHAKLQIRRRIKLAGNLKYRC